MTEQVEVGSEKTPGDLKREEIANKLNTLNFGLGGGGWEWFVNCSKETGFSTEEDRATRRLIKELERQHKQGIIRSYKTNQPAFDQNGNPIENMTAIYIQHPLPETSIK